MCESIFHSDMKVIFHLTFRPRRSRDQGHCIVDEHTLRTRWVTRGCDNNGMRTRRIAVGITHDGAALYRRRDRSHEFEYARRYPGCMAINAH